MINRLLFAVVIFLMGAIVAIGTVALVRNPAMVPETAQGIVNKVVPTSPTPTPTPTPTATTFTLAQIAMHNSAASCYTTIAGGVYDLTDWINQHPGGREAILSLCGRDGTTAFEAQHAGQSRPEQELASLKIGTLK